MKENKDILKTDINISLLKMLMCFCVVLAHCWNKKGYDSLFFFPFKEMQLYAAPIFMIIAFYYTEPLFIFQDPEKYRNRVRRILIPHIVWALVYWIIFFLLYKTPVIELFWQLLTGHSSILNPAMWFQAELLLYTLLFFCVFHIFDERKSLLAIFVFLLLSLLLEFSETNYALFGNLRIELSYPLGRIAEIFPFAAIGFFFRYFNIIEKLKRYRYFVLILSPVLLLFPFIVEFPKTEGFGYSGIMPLYLSVHIFVFASMLPLNDLPVKYKKIAVMISSYTLGIYCLHRLVQILLPYLFPDFTFSSFTGCILIYIACYFVCFLISLIPDKTVRSAVD